jgi:hypothetical protein
VFENRVLRELSGPKRHEVTRREYRRQRSKKLCDLYSPYIISMIRLRKLRWPGHRARMGEQRVIEDFGRETYVNETSWKS